MAKKNMEQVNVMARIYATANASDTLAVAKQMRGLWHWYTVPMTAENVAALCSDVEETNTSDGLKFRFRPSNGAFYRVATRNGVQPAPLASEDTVIGLVSAISAETGARVNRGTAIECLVAEALGASWSYQPTQQGFWAVPDVIAADGRRVQVKAYGGSVCEKDLRAAAHARLRE